MKTSDKVLRMLSLYVKAGSSDSIRTFRHRDYYEIHDMMVGTYREVKDLEKHPLNLLDKWVEKYK